MGFCRISTSPSFIPPPSPERRISSIVRRNRSNVSTPRVIVTPGNSRRTSVSLLPAGCASCHHRISRCAPNTCPYTSNEYCSPVSPVFVFYKLTPRAWKEFVSKRWRRTDGSKDGQGWEKFISLRYIIHLFPMYRQRARQQRLLSRLFEEIYILVKDIFSASWLG